MRNRTVFTGSILATIFLGSGACVYDDKRSCHGCNDYFAILV
jgi:hypothetical protein